MIRHCIYIAILCFGFVACTTTEPNSQWSRRSPQHHTSLDSLEMLLNDEDSLALIEKDENEIRSGLHIGMLKNSVESYWGRPDQIEVAGRPGQGVERWTYERQVPTMAGSYKEKKVIYFEAGSVVGWETY